MLSKLYGWIDRYGGDFNVLFVEPGIGGRKKECSSVDVFKFFVWVNREEKLNLNVKRMVLPAIEGKNRPNSVSIFVSDGKTNVVIIDGIDDVSIALSKSITRQITRSDQWSFMCEGKETTFDDFNYTCPVVDRFTRGVNGLETVVVSVGEIIEGINGSVDRKEQIGVFQREVKNISRSLGMTLRYSQVISDPYRYKELKMIKTLLEKKINFEGDQSAIFIAYKKLCKMFSLKRSSSTEERVFIFKIFGEIYLYIFIEILRLGM